jgi:succinate dehydrogenase / fumarate reductase flavoprotein subunit
MALDLKIPNGPISDKWTNYKITLILLILHKRNLDVIVVGTGLVGGSASATLRRIRI